MTEAPRHDREILPILEHESGVGMTEIVEPLPRKGRRCQRDLELVRDVARIKRSADGAREHVVRVMPARSRRKPRRELPATAYARRLVQEWRSGDHDGGTEAALVRDIQKVTAFEQLRQSGDAFRKLARPMIESATGTNGSIDW